tara:strand:- start:134 stop:895 length:762 start_codon:yes stop_codon:yes gene_type:complete
MFNKNIEFISKKPFTLFKINDFLSNNLYERLEDNYPDLKNLNIGNLEDFKNKKYAFDTSSDVHKSVINSNTSFLELEKIIFSEEFFKFFYKTFYIDFLRSRINKPSHILKLLKYPKVVKDLNKEGLFYLLNPLNKIKIEIQYSYILNGGKIVPHTDSGEKLLSLMLYFPLKNYDYEKQQQLGTSFWTSSFNNFDNYHQYDNKNIKDIKLFHKTQFKPNILYGFIKNHASWHSVEPVSISENFVRRSININFYF